MSRSPMRRAGPLVLLFALLALVATIGAGQAASALPAVPQDGTEPLPAGASIQTVLSNMTAPIAMAFDPQGRLFYTEKATGNVRLFANGTLQTAPVITFNVDSCSERGLLGIAIDPAFSSNHYIYVYYTANPSTSCASTTNNVARFVEQNGVGSNPQIIFSSPQDAGNHNGGNIHFGPDGKLYVSIGDNATAANAQNVTVKNGKMHRLNPDGSIPADNPVFTQTGALPSLYAFGLRNSFDFTFDPLNPGRIFASENGPSCDDEMNRIVGGYNYGWRDAYPCDDTNPSPTYNTIPPLWYLGSAVCCEAPTGITVYSGSQVTQWHNDLFMATYNTGELRHFYLDSTRTHVTTVNIVQGVTVNTDIETGPDGAFWYIEGGGYASGTLKRIVGPGPTPTPAPTTCPLPFTDVDSTNPFRSYIQCLYCRGIISGYSNNTFLPNNNVSRGQAAKIIANAAAYNDAIPSTRQTFSDVPYGHPFWLYIERAVLHGAISGYNSSPPCPVGQTPCFLPNNSITRAQLTKVDVLAGGYSDVIPSTRQSFADVPYGNPYWLYLERAYLHSIISGYTGDGMTINPCTGQVETAGLLYVRFCNSITRAQTSKIVANTFYPNCQTP